MTRILFLLPFLLVISGCTNPYSQFYQDLTGGKNILEEPRVIISMDEPKLKQGIDPDDDCKKMLENGYYLIGQSCFNAGSLSQDAAITQAKKVHADTVIVYSGYTHTVSGVMPLTVPNTRTGTAYHSGTIYGSGGGSANYSGSSRITTYGTNTTYVPYQVARYDYLATYWVKLKPHRLGIHWDDLTDELRKKVGSNKGIYIIAVVKGSPAFNSDLLTGDVIRRVNGIEVIDKNHFEKWLDETRPSEIVFEIFRNGEYITKRVQPRYSDTATDAGPTGGHSQPTTIDQNVSTNKTPEEAKKLSEDVKKQQQDTQKEKNQEQPNAPITKSPTVIQCGNCGHEIGRLERAYVHDGHIVCSQCFLKLKQQP